ncbi:delta(3:5)-Delta(2:4)-dienoyl-CoA isomerase: mitochondrial-like isoform X1 [Dinothrombium tinctorium]|uniref:Delta(3:5)-Delta(2:4)-dienoyl-CoA isomerase: mitochondrial-like isoform X1 n=2 Tax=Dinothrombium tinctorium TaxID=1965070 RepID=A0A443QY87_9ACAR|nr:delta(3:5)-Delta(2:4)-dienoyl-CoA isomerase: mitochondrial-like isoform X1 [Dinothrombium tinctorium]
MLDELMDCFKRLHKDPHIRAIILSGNGKMFSGGIDLFDFQNVATSYNTEDIARRALKIRETVTFMQQSFLTVANCQKPVISVMHSACIGAGVDLISATDMRYCTQDAWFQIKEVDIAIAADMGTLQYFPEIIGNDSTFRELVFTGRKIDADEAKQIGFVSKVLPNFEAAKEAAIETAKLIASKSPVAVLGAKVCMNHSREKRIADSLKFQAVWNSAMAQTEDVIKAAMASATKSESPTFDDL